MAAKAFVIVHNNPFNKSVVCKDNLSFSTKDDLSEILDRPNILSKREELSQKNLEIINSKYRWDIIIEKYEKYFLKILGNKKI